MPAESSPWLSRGPDGECSAREDEGNRVGESFHCFHLHGDSAVCCWCGDLFQLSEDDEPREHGEYAAPDLGAG